VITVCQVFGDYNYGGIARFVADLSSRLKDNLQVTMLCRKAIRKPEEGLNLVELKPRNTVDLWRKLTRIGEFDIIHCHDVYALPALVRNKGRKAKIVYTAHGIVPWRYSRAKDSLGWVLAYLCARYALPRVDLAIGMSDYILGELQDRYKCRNIAKIPGGVDTKKFCMAVGQNSSLKLEGKPILLYVGLIEKHKGVKFLIHSMQHILKEFPDALLVLIGTGRDEKSLRQYVRRSGLEGKVIFLGFVEHNMLTPYYNASDTHIEPAYCHGFGLPIIEAMACGKPVITRDAYAMREHILNSRAGVLFKRDDAKELVNAIREIIGNYEEYASSARKYSENFDLSLMASEYVKKYIDLVNENGEEAKG